MILTRVDRQMMDKALLRNIRYDRIYQSKLLKTIRRGQNLYADGFFGTDGINSGLSTNVDTSRATASGYVGPTGNTLLLLHMDGTDAATAFVDSSSYARTITPNGNVQIDTAQFAFGGASALFDGTGDYLSVPDSADWAFGSGDFTVDCRVCFNTLGATICGQAADGNNGWRLYKRSDTGNLQFDLSVAGSYTVQFTGAISWSTTTWHHVALVKYGTSYTIYADGVSVGTTTDTDTIIDFAGALHIGHEGLSNGYMNGWIDEFRVSNVARWTSNFTPPASVYSLDLNNMTLTGATQTADSAVSLANLLIEADLTRDTVALNTDLIGKVTCDNWTTPQTVTLVNAGKGQSGHTLLEALDVPCVSGNGFAPQIVTPTGKDIQIYGVALDAA